MAQCPPIRTLVGVSISNLHKDGKGTKILVQTSRAGS